MKTKLIYIVTILCSIGMVTPLLAISPDKTKDEKSTTEQLVPPPPNWTAYVIISDFNDSCAYNLSTCDLWIYAEAATSNCIGVATWSTEVQFHAGTRTYPIPNIPSDYPCVIISIISKGGCIPGTDFNANTCCYCRDHPQVCVMEVCP